MILTAALLVVALFVLAGSSHHWLPMVLSYPIWIGVGLYGAGALGALLRGKRETLLVLAAIVGAAGYGIFLSWKGLAPWLPPAICLAIIVLLGGVAKTAGDEHDRARKREPSDGG
jgi:hypothetical protein